jgi:hypothetical protein
MTSDPRCYTVAEVLDKLKMPRRTFTQLKAEGKLPFLDELRPRLGRTIRYRADLIDRYLAGQWGQPRAFGEARRHG